MTTLRRIGPASAFKIGFLTYALLGFIAGVLCSTMAFAGIHFGPHAQLPFSGVWLGVAPLVLCPLIYGIAGGIAAIVGALLYNLVSGWVGGLEVDVS